MTNGIYLAANEPLPNDIGEQEHLLWSQRIMTKADRPTHLRLCASLTIVFKLSTVLGSIFDMPSIAGYRSVPELWDYCKEPRGGS